MTCGSLAILFLFLLTCSTPLRQKPSTGSCSTAVKRRMSLHVLSSAAFDERP